MAAQSYTTVITQVDESTINFAIPTAGAPPVTVITPTSSTFENLLNAYVFDMAGLIPTSPLPNSYNLDSTAGGFGDDYTDSVYQYDGVFTAGADTYTSEEYLLVVLGIDAAIAAWPVTNGRTQATLDWAEAKRVELQAYFDAANYVEANRDILIIRAIIVRPYTKLAVLPATSVNTDNTQIEITIDPISYLFFEGYYNEFENTLTGDLAAFTWNFDATNVADQTHQLVPSDLGYATVFLDGVYRQYNSGLFWVDDGGYDINVNSGRLIFSNSYCLITTTIDDQIQLFEDNYDPDNTAEAIALADLQSLQTQIAAAYAAEDYDLTNELIAQAQAILANGLSREISAALTSDADMNVFFTVPPAMPVGTYTTSTSTITNTLTGVAFTFDGFPLSASDLTQLLNSETLGFGADFPDGTYQIVVPFYVDGLLFTAECYLVVTTDWQCCIDKAAGKKCGKLNTALMQANLTNAVRIVALYSDVNTANALISEGNRECSSCGCGCS